MRLRSVYVRFYKSFNFDYLRKNDPKVKIHQPWEILEDKTWYPHVRVNLEDTITTIVGANESGKTHLLKAIKKGITGLGIERHDFCRYSRFFAVERGQVKWPEFGFDWHDISAEDRDAVKAACGLGASAGDFSRFLMFRTAPDRVVVFLPEGENKYSEHPVAKLDVLGARLPHVFEIDANVALPDSVLIRQMGEDSAARATRFGRSERMSFMDTLETLERPWLADAATFQKSAPSVYERVIGPFLKAAAASGDAASQAQVKLTRDLFHKVAGIDPKVFGLLYEALKSGQEGYANGLIQKINDCLARELNFPKWWIQDKDFNLRVSVREQDLVLTIRDRTGTDYLVKERSSGLKYFLSYYVQYLAHEPKMDRSEILLMDEPDAYLSAQAQQDLLKIFHAFSTRQPGRPPVQVAYVTHSPFLIDRNHAERIRVLDKGRNDEGTRVVRDAARNHYEPLRSSLGAFVGETTFIGHCNLMVEGLADQILLAGAATLLRAANAPQSETIDLNHVTIVPCGSASHIPYMVYLARGRDIDKPAVVVLLDSDTAGNDARSKLEKGCGPKPQGGLLKKDYIIQISDMNAVIKRVRPMLESEDLVPLGLCVAAARTYALEFCGVDEATVKQITVQGIEAALKAGADSHFAAVQACLKALPGAPHIEKVGFARLVVDCLASVPASDRQEFEANMRALFRLINSARRSAERELNNLSVSRRIERAKHGLLQDYPHEITRDRAGEILEDMEAVLDDSVESDHLKSAIQGLRRDFKLAEELGEPVSDYGEFRNRVEQLSYVARIATQT